MYRDADEVAPAFRKPVVSDKRCTVSTCSVDESNHVSYVRLHQWVIVHRFDIVSLGSRRLTPESALL
jgi:hypothetical protein